jgi:L-fuconate dehydratase
MFDYVAAGLARRAAHEFVDSLHAQFVEPLAVARGSHVSPLTLGCSIALRLESRSVHIFPDGIAWRQSTPT